MSCIKKFPLKLSFLFIFYIYIYSLIKAVYLMNSNFIYINIEYTINNLYNNMYIVNKINKYLYIKKKLLICRQNNEYYNNYYFKYFKFKYYSNYLLKSRNILKKYVFFNIKNDLKIYQLIFRNNILKKLKILIEKMRLDKKLLLVLISNYSFFIKSKLYLDYSNVLIYQYCKKFHKKTLIYIYNTI